MTIVEQMTPAAEPVEIKPWDENWWLMARWMDARGEIAGAIGVFNHVASQEELGGMKTFYLETIANLRKVLDSPLLMPRDEVLACKAVAAFARGISA